MKIVRAIPVIVAVSIVLVVVPYMLNFAHELSSEADHWAAFGSYIGGTLSPIIAGLALIAFLETVAQQQKQLEALRVQAATADLHRVIQKVEQDYEETLGRHRVSVDIDGRPYELTALDVVQRLAFVHYAKVMVNQADIEKRLAEGKSLPLDDPDIARMEAFGMAAGHLNQLRLYVQAHQEIAKNNVLVKYHQRKHKLAYDRFMERGFLHTPWKTKDEDQV